jgi:chromosome segregation protein
MRLKKLEIAGFKSFMDRTSLHFEPGVTAVVGPNGCGKSNIVDAIRWAMGEQSAKTLRGHSMEDVIFNGSDDHQALGMAEVIITFENTNGHAPPELTGRTEIEVSRRLFRSGESEYAINRVPCRRRDVWELFMDTGLGNRSYAIVEQDRVSRIIQAKPEERRVIIEEVAGISKYKSRKEAAERKIEATGQNLLRIQDIRREVGQQVQGLERQAKKAERYKRLRGEILELERRLVLRRWKALRGEATAVEAQCRCAEAQRDDLLARLQVKESSLESEHLAGLQKEQELAEAQEAVFRKASEAKALEAKVQGQLEEIQRIQSMTGLLENESRDLEERIQRARQEAERFAGQGVALAGEKAQAERRAHEVGVTVHRLLEERDALTENVETAKAQLVEWFSERATLRNSLIHHQRQVEELDRTLARHREEKEELENKVRDLQGRAEEAGARIQGEEDRLRALQDERTLASGRLAQLEMEREGARTAVENVRMELQEASARLRTLQELQESLEGFGEGVRALRASHRSGEILAGRPLKVLAEVMEVAEGAEGLVGSLLGERLQYLVVQEMEDAVEALSHVREKALGRVGFVAVQPARWTGIQGEDGALREGGNGLLLDQVQWEKGYEPLGEILLGGVRLVDDAQKALEAWRNNGHCALLTRMGEVLHPPGILEGGERRDASTGYLGRKREMRHLRGRVQALGDREAELCQARQRLDQETLSLTGEAGRLQMDAHTAEIRITETKNDLALIQESLKGCGQRLEVLRWEADERGGELVRIRESMEQDSLGLQEVEGRIQKGEELVQAGEEERGRVHREVESLRADLTQTQVHLASVSERCESLERETVGLLRRLEELTQQKERKDLQRHQETQRAGSLSEELARTREELHAQIQAHHWAEERFQAARRDLEEHRAGLLEGDRVCQEERKEARELERGLQGLVLQHQELALRMEHVEGELKGRLEMAPADIPNTAEALPAGDAEQEQGEVASLKESLERMGDVNLAAAEQYEELRDRYDFLTAQQEDLEESIRSLNKAIQKINRTSRKRFREAFEALDAQFQKVFPVLFGGGEARLVLTETPDVLEAGVDIVARPRGKRPQSITLLSGGEKALTAVALIFAMIMIKPTPFCLFDEVDAPLDDANIDRFNRMVRDLSQGSQFVLVTHNKRTMEMADALYGVTMDRPGISKMISVRLQ